MVINIPAFFDEKCRYLVTFMQCCVQCSSEPLSYLVVLLLTIAKRQVISREALQYLDSRTSNIFQKNVFMKDIKICLHC